MQIAIQWIMFKDNGKLYQINMYFTLFNFMKITLIYTKH